MKLLKRRQIALVLAIVLSFLLFVAGLISGLTAKKIAEESSKKDYDFLINYVDRLDSELGSIQIQEAFIDSLEEDERCEFADDYFSQVGDELTYYYSVFPNRLEEFEKNQDLPEEYLILKEQYTELSLRAWLIAKDNKETCGTNIIPILYFYSKDCEACVEQGENLDILKQEIVEEGNKVLIFTLDKDIELNAVSLIKKYYGVKETPALIINNNALQGRVYSSKEILEVLNE